MSTLTKVLIVLLTISAIFLCGIVVTYVAGSVNYKERYDNMNQNYRAAETAKDNALKQYNDLKAQTEQAQQQASNQMSQLQNQVDSLQAKLAEAERQNALLLQKVNNWTSIAQDFTATNDRQGQLLQNALDELDRVQTELINEQTQHKETTTSLVEKLAVIDSLEDKNKQLTEEKTELQNRLDQLLRQFGKTIAPPTPVTPAREPARIAPPVENIGLKGTVAAVDLKNSLAQISIGSANGVKDGMRFHVVRNNQFVCDIVIFNVEPDKAVGILDLLKPDMLPRVGDQVTTNL